MATFKILFRFDDVDDNDLYTVNDIITIFFESDTNFQNSRTNDFTVINDLFTFSDSIGDDYIGRWLTPDAFTITIKDTANAALSANVTTVTPAGTIPILSADNTSEPSTIQSPPLVGVFQIRQ